MDPERWKQIEQLCHAALEREESQRSAFLKEASGGDETLRREVESLLAQQQEVEDFIEAPALEVVAKGLAKDQVESLVGRQISSYKILSLLGAGGMGEVYLAQDTTLDRKVALKFLPEELQQDSTARKRFLREAKSAAALDHPFICQIHEVGEVEGKSFISMEYVQGETLKDKLAKGPLPLNDALEKATEVAEALEEAHKQGIVHRDLKPANIMLTPQGHVKVMDFGLAKRVTLAEGQEQEITTALTQQGSTLGTVPYMSPEQVRGQAVDTRSDIFSFGVVLYEMLTGVNPFKGNTSVDTSHAILGETPPPLTRYTDDVPVLLQHTVKKMLAKEPDDRYQLIHEVRTNLGEHLEKSGGSISEVAMGLTGVSSAAGWWRRAIPWSIIAVVIVIAVSMALWRSPQPVPAPTTKLIITPPATAPLNNGEGIDLAISPDGRNVVYVAESESTTQLYLHSLDQFTPTPISGTEGSRGLFFSPDGESVAFFGPGQLKKVSLQGGPAVAICEIPFDGYGSWSSEDIIVFGSAETGSELYRVLASGGEPESLAGPDFDKGETDYRFPEILPGGSTVLFTIFGRDGWQIAVLSLESREQKILLEGARQAHYVDTGHLIYEAAVSGALMGVPFDLERLEVTGDPVPLLQGIRYNPSSAVDYAFSRSGTLVYVPLRTSEQRLIWVDREGTERVITQEKGTLATPRISPDGRQVSVTVLEDDGSRNVWIYSFEQDSLNRLTFEGDFSSTQNWSPDGQWIVFQSGREGLRGMYRQLADGSGPPQQLTALTPTAQVTDSWSPDGRVLTFSRGNDIWVLSMDGNGEPQPLINSPNVDECCSQFSPDGRSFAYLSDETGQQHVYISPYPKPSVKWQVSGEEGGGQPVWSPDGRELFYRSGDKIMVVSVQMEPSVSLGKPRVLFEGSYVKSPFAFGKQYYDIAPDGKRFLMIKDVEGRTAQINVVLNWFEELKRLVPTN